MKHRCLLILLLPFTGYTQTPGWSPCDSFSNAAFAQSSPDGACYLQCEWRQEAEPIEYRLTLKSRKHQKSLVVSETSVYDSGAPAIRWSDDSRLLLVDSDDSRDRVTRVIDLDAFRETQAIPGYLYDFDSPHRIAFVGQYLDDQDFGRPDFALYKYDLEQNQSAVVVQLEVTWDFDGPQFQADPNTRTLLFRLMVYCDNGGTGGVREFSLGY
ncbi:MAG: hypothetical protein H6565_12995 [Lewinellaceae bacterium]|nr:hypothetical protein [Saprospiraceae bacterium]MCB9307505.1 hypothetical protein [Lewinellaceae bacterium]